LKQRGKNIIGNWDQYEISATLYRPAGVRKNEFISLDSAAMLNFIRNLITPLSNRCCNGWRGYAEKILACYDKEH